jgi:hypothetical protein
MAPPFAVRYLPKGTGSPPRFGITDNGSVVRVSGFAAQGSLRAHYDRIGR